MLSVFKFNEVCSKTSILIYNDYIIHLLGDHMYVIYSSDNDYKKALQFISESLDINIYMNYFGFVSGPQCAVIDSFEMKLKPTNINDLKNEIISLKNINQKHWNNILHEKIKR